MSRLTLAAAVIALAGAAAAQHQPGSHGTTHAPQGQHGGAAQPYAGLEKRAVTSLSEQQIADLRAGRGMGLALPAELNGYPGPIHVLELAEPLGLTEPQRARMQALYAAMKAEAVPLGERLIAQEADLDAAFRTRSVTAASLSERTRLIGATSAALREAHLKYHLATLEVLSPEQVARYGVLRGYAKP